MSYLDRRPESDPRHALLMEEGRAARRKRMQRNARRRRVAALAAILLAAVLLGGWLLSRAGDPPRATARTRDDDRMPKATMSSAKPKAPDPTPVFATYADIVLRVPVPTANLTDIAFHQAAYSYARHLDTVMPTYPTDSATQKRGTGRTAATSVANAQGWLDGYVLRLWRDRPGEPDSAADVGAAPGTPVLAPVSGTVLLVKPYKLYGKYDDFEVHIRPAGHEDLDLVMIHVDDPKVAVGQQVDGGVTQVGAVRMLSNRMRLQLGSFTTGSGDHTHVQLNLVKPGTTEGVGSS